MSNHDSRIAWGIIGTGTIAHTFARGLAKSRTGQLVAVGSRTQASADAFGKEVRDHPTRTEVTRRCSPTPPCKAVYISTPHPTHAEWCIKAARAQEAHPLRKAAHAQPRRGHGRRRGHARERRLPHGGVHVPLPPATARLVELIRSGAIGQVGVIQATFSFQAGFNAEGRLFKNELGGGGILDVGCYTTSIARLVAGVAPGQTLRRAPQGHRLRATPSRDENRSLRHRFRRIPRRHPRQVATGVALNQDNGLRVFGSEGSLHLPTPYLMAREWGKDLDLHYTRGQDRGDRRRDA